MEIKEIADKLNEIFRMAPEEPKGIRLMTGPGGMDLFNECMEEDYGLKRIYVNKIPRFTKIFRWKTSYTGRKYRLLKIVL
jgi:hypothetical protein